MTDQLEHKPFRSRHQASVRNLVLERLAEHWGDLDERLNPDLRDIGRACSGGSFAERAR